jgi:PAS domain S-box-containing protein
LRTGEGYELDVPVIRSDGTRIWVTTRGEVVRQPNGQITGLRGTAQDITERKRAEDALREREEQLRFVTDHAPVLIVQCDAAGRYKFVNAPYAARFGIQPHEAVGRLIPEVVGSRAYATFQEHVESALRGERVEFEINIPYDQIGPRWMHCVYVADIKPGGEVAGFVAVLQDVTLRKEAEAAVRESEGRLRLFIEHAPAAIAMFDRQMRYLAVSARWKQDYRLPRDLSGLCHYDVFPDLPERWKEVHRRGLQGEVLSADEDPFRRADGTVQWVKWEVRPWQSGTGQVGGILIAAEDVTARVRTRHALIESEAVLKSVTNTAQVGLVMVSEERRYLFANHAYAEILGLPNTQLVGLRVSDVLRHVYDQIGPRLDQAFSGDRVNYELRVAVHPRTGEERFYDVVYEPRTQNVAAPYVVVVIVDITERRRIQQTLERLVAQRTAKLQETIGELESFSYSIAHDMRAPLRSLQGFSEILLEEYEGKLDMEGQVFLRRIVMAAARMDRLIQDVLTYSRVMRGELPQDRVDVGQLLRDIVDTYPTFAPEKAEIRLEGPFPPVLGNEAMLTQVFSNLIGNAIKFVSPGVKPQIRVWTESENQVRTAISAESEPGSSLAPEAAAVAAGGRVRLFVQDNGIGIATDQHEKIFGIFQQVDNRYEGTGIGLSIVKKAVERLGGKVGLQSEPGKGSTFWIELPRAGDPAAELETSPR